MSFSGLILTNSGRNELAKAEMGEKFHITDIVFGDGRYSGTMTNIKELVHPIMSLPVTKIERDEQNEGGVIVECDFNSTDISKPFFWREIGIVANGKLCYYDNSREDAEYIDPESETIIKQKRMRFVLLISPDVKVNVTVGSSLYALDEDMQSVLNPVFEECQALENIESGDTFFEILGKIKSAIEDFFRHKISGDHDGRYYKKADVDKLISEAAFGGLYHGNIDDVRGVNEVYWCCKKTDFNPPTTGTLPDGMDYFYLITEFTSKTGAGVQMAIGVTGTKKFAIRDWCNNRWYDWCYYEPLTLDGKTYINRATPEFTEASARSNINSKETMPTILGKIKKFFSDLKTVAFTGSYNDLLEIPKSFTPTAHTHDDRYYTETEVNNLLSNYEPITLEGKTYINRATPEFTEASARSNINSKETMPTILGKIKKIFSDLKTVAFTGSYNDLLEIPKSFTPAAHTHDDRYYTETEVNNLLRDKIVKIEKTYVSAPNVQVGANNYNAYTYSEFLDQKPGYTLLSTNVEVDKDLIYIGFHYQGDRTLRVSFYNAYGAAQTISIVVIRQIWLKN